MASLFLDICLSDIPKERIKWAANGKAYIKVNVGELRQKDERGNDHFISVYVPKDERHDGDKPIYIGRGKANQRNASPNAPKENTASPAPTSGKDDDLPF